MKLAIATPIRAHENETGEVTYGYMRSVMALRDAMGALIIPPPMTYGLDVMRARNRMAGYVLREHQDVSHILWWDDDVWPEDVTIVQSMLDTGADVVAAPYTNKNPPLRWAHRPLMPPPPVQANGLHEYRWLGFGFTLTTTRALQWMSDECARRMTHEWRVYSDGKDRNRVASLFGPLYAAEESVYQSKEDEMLLSEDYSFCERWRQLGGKVHVYARGGVVYHAGPHAYSVREFEK